MDAARTVQVAQPEPVVLLGCASDRCLVSGVGADFLDAQFIAAEKGEDLVLGIDLDSYGATCPQLDVECGDLWSDRDGHVPVVDFRVPTADIRCRRVVVDVSRLMPITVAVLAVFVLLGLTSLYLDVVDPIPNPY